MRARVTHELKSWPEFFQATLNAHKRFELRRDDRPDGFQMGDQLRLREWDPVVCDVHFSHTSNPEEAQERAYTGREVLVRVDYVMDASKLDALLCYPNEVLADAVVRHKAKNYVIMSISNLQTNDLLT